MSLNNIIRLRAQPVLSRVRRATVKSLPPPSLDASTASRPRSIFNPLVLAYLGDAVWEAHTRRLEVDIEASLNRSKQHAEEKQSASIQKLAREAPRNGRAGHGRGREAFSSGRWGIQESAGRGRGRRSGRNVLQHSDVPSSGTSDDPDGPGRQERKQWSTANYQALVFDALIGGTLQPSPTEPPRPAPDPAPGDQMSAAAQMALTPEEVEVLRWGRNAAVSSIPRNVPALVYKKATAVEVLVAHLYLTNPERCAQLIAAAVAAPLGTSQQQEASAPSTGL